MCTDVKELGGMAHAFLFQSPCSYYFAASTGKTEFYWLSFFFWLELNWPSSQYWIHLLIKFYLRCPNSWTRGLCDLGLCERPTFLTVSSITPLLACTHCPHCFLVLKNFLPLKAAHFGIFCLFTQGFLCLKFFMHSISTHPSRPQSNVISSVKSPLIPSSRVNNSLLRFPTVLCTYQKYSLRAFFYFSVIFLSLHICLCHSSFW